MLTDQTAATEPRRVVLVGSSLFGSRAIKRLGMSYLLVCDPEEDPHLAIADAERMVRVPYRSDPKALLDLPRPSNVQAVMSFTEYGLQPASDLAEAWSVAGVPAVAVRASRDKLLMRERLAAIGDALPAGSVRDAGDVPAVHYPVIVKPVDGVAGVGVRHVSDSRELKEILATATEPLMWERYMTGVELSVETVSVNGQHHVLGITQKITTGRPNFVERGHLTPAPLSRGEAARVTECVARCLDAIGLTMGPAHTEVILGTDEAFVIETHTRPGGGRIPLITEFSAGVDQYESAVRALCGISLADIPEPIGAAGVEFLESPPGILVDITGVDEARRLGGVVEVAIDTVIGDHRKQWESNLDRSGFVVARGANLNEVRENIAAAVRTISFEVSPD